MKAVILTIACIILSLLIVAYFFVNHNPEYLMASKDKQQEGKNADTVAAAVVVVAIGLAIMAKLLFN